MDQRQGTSEVAGANPAPEILPSCGHELSGFPDEEEGRTHDEKLEQAGTMEIFRDVMGCPEDEGQKHDGEGRRVELCDTKSEHTTISQAARNARASFTSPRRLVLAAGTVLAVCAGIVDVVAWLKLGSFVSHMSGNVAHMGMRVEGNHAGRDSPADLREAVLLVVAFILGSMLCGLLIARNEVHFGKELYGVALLGNSTFLITGLLFSECQGMTEVAKYFLAAACGLQNGMCTMHFGAICRTTHVTGIVTDAGTTIGRLLAILLRRSCLWTRLDALDRAEFEVDVNKLRVYSLLGFGFFFGASGGAYLSRWMGVYALLVPASITGLGGGTYTLFREQMKRRLDQLERSRLSEDMEEVEHILERTRCYLNRISNNPGGPGSATPSSACTSRRTDWGEATAADVVGLDEQMNHVLGVMHSVEASIEVLYSHQLKSARSPGHSLSGQSPRPPPQQLDGQSPRLDGCSPDLGCLATSLPGRGLQLPAAATQRKNACSPRSPLAANIALAEEGVPRSSEP